MVENLPANPGDEGLIPELGRSPGEGNGNPVHPVFLPGEFPWTKGMGLQRVRHN